MISNLFIYVPIPYYECCYILSKSKKINTNLNCHLRKWISILVMTSLVHINIIEPYTNKWPPKNHQLSTPTKCLCKINTRFVVPILKVTHITTFRKEFCFPSINNLICATTAGPLNHNIHAYKTHLKGHFVIKISWVVKLQIKWTMFIDM